MRRVSGMGVAAVLVIMGCGDGGEGPDSTLAVAWSFENGDCAELGIETIRVEWTEEGAAAREAEFPCEDGEGVLGEIPEGGATYSFVVEGMDADGVVRARNFGNQASFEQAATTGPVDITLHPSPVDVVVTWSHASGGTCPGMVILPYYVSLYDASDEDSGELTDQVKEVQESCQSGQATLMQVAPGDYVVEIDSRAVTPAVRGSAPLTVVAGEEATLHIDL